MGIRDGVETIMTDNLEIKASNAVDDGRMAARVLSHDGKVTDNTKYRNVTTSISPSKDAEVKVQTVSGTAKPGDHKAGAHDASVLIQAPRKDAGMKSQTVAGTANIGDHKPVAEDVRVAGSHLIRDAEMKAQTVAGSANIGDHQTVSDPKITTHVATAHVAGSESRKR